MIAHPLKPCPLEPKHDERQLRPQDMRLQSPRVELVDTDPMLLGMRMGNLIYAAVFGLLRGDERQ